MDYKLLELDSVVAFRAFAYKGKSGGFDGLSEDDVKDAVKCALERMSYDVKVSWGRKQGIDIEAKLGGTRIVIEAAGEGTSRQHLGNNFVRVLAEIIQRMTDDSASYAIAFPAHASFIELALKIPNRVRQVLRLDIYIVRRSPSGFETGTLHYLKT